MVYNNLKIATHPVSMHSMGLHYSPYSEGSMYYRGKEANGTAITFAGNAIHPGECFVYKVRFDINTHSSIAVHAENIFSGS